MKSFKDILHPEMSDSEYLDMPYETKYTEIVEALGYESVKKCIPFSLKSLQEAYETDENLNNLGIGTWDKAAGFSYNMSHRGGMGNYLCIGSPLITQYRNIGVTQYSCADGVCILKQCAKMWIEETARS